MEGLLKMHPFDGMEDVLPHITPFFSALAGTSFVILLSNNFKGGKKIMFQTAAIASATAASVSYLFKNPAVLGQVWEAYKTLSYEVKLALAVFLVGSTYFGGALYVSGLVVPENNDSQAPRLEFPATVDAVTQFSVPSNLPKDETQFFVAMFSKFTEEIVADIPTVYQMPDEAVQYIHRMIKYTVDGGKMNRGLAVVSVCECFAKVRGGTLSNKERVQAAALGWCVEFLQAFFLVADDVMDDSVTRRGQPCWFRLEDVKLISINDSFILESCVYKILKRYFGTEAYYPQLVDLFLEVTRQTEFGQLLDLTSQRLDKTIDLSRFTIQRYTSIVLYKTAFYSFYLPVALGMIVSGISRKSLYDKAREILLKMGEYFQIQDDFLDCYGDPKVIGKIGTDIQDNKCSWLVVQALNLCSPEQRRTLESNYGRHEEAKIKAVKALYNDIGIKAVFERYEEQSYVELQKLIAEVDEIPHEVFNFLLNKIYKRSK